MENSKRLAIFAHFDKKNVIDDYVLFYVTQLKKYCTKVLFVSLSELPQNEVQKLDDLILVKHNEYDFGSYKIGFNYAKEKGFLKNIDEVIFVNDSCFCINSLDKIFEKEQNNDFWGIVENQYGFKKIGKICISEKNPHLQSWFLAFRKQVFESKIFQDFMNGIEEQRNKNDVILNYEIGLTKSLKTAGFTHGAYVENFKKSYNPSIYNWRELVENGLPFIKCSVLRGLNRDKTTIEGWENLVEEEQKDFIKKNIGEIRINKFLNLEQKLLMYKLLANSSDINRRITTKILKTFCPFVFD